jgi:hypothetical protein
MIERFWPLRSIQNTMQMGVSVYVPSVIVEHSSSRTKQPREIPECQREPHFVQNTFQSKQRSLPHVASIMFRD